MKNFLRISIIGMMCVVLIASFAFPGEKKIAKKDVPESVLKAFSAAYPNAKVNAYAKEVEKGKTYYELESVDGKVKRDILYNVDGTVAEIEEVLMPGAVPEVIAKAFGTAMPKAKILNVEKTTRGAEVRYEFHALDGKKKVEVVFNADGSLLKKSAKNSKEEKEEDEDDDK